MIGKGVMKFGSRRVHAIQTETVFRRLAACGVAVENAAGARKDISCPACLHYLRSVGHSG